MSNQVVLRLSDEDLAQLQRSIGSRHAAPPAKQFASKACFIRSSKALNQAPGYNEVEIVVGHLKTGEILRNLGLVRRFEDDIDYKRVAEILQEQWEDFLVGFPDEPTMESAISEYKKRFPVGL